MERHVERRFRRFIPQMATGRGKVALRWIGAALCAGMLSQAAQAIPVTWVLSGITFADGGTASGTFVYDADANVFSAINIVTTPNPPLGATYGVATGLGNMLFFDTIEGLPAAGNDRLLFDLLSPLTNAGGAITINFASTLPDVEGTCTTNTCDSLFPFRLITAGGVMGSVNGVPEPAGWLLVLLGAAAGALSRRKTR